ncbi:MAG: hypothetical protein A2836_01370 [Candidatus Taylorbacteria bacterium RIFCSPHIGHO2_01_FULL_45_63]|uniref:PEGA domain-containing protein n=1 Tax=Candidatus Taylorbacteria bacterium RIFCSPHIGHO2_02_FULL_45_35 TaxID=1802311 RepID=A0A1G2MYR0_9BACT|nr:MAG: hypothetical protein A2836_01370 [Candidatus Taylorbacteria bacterium RIFCSPHIGHO2_01_FULL_45_63]OHA28061.1 MAG: hypothetical protein A3D56_00075 [Candidatus Taylorbacteria bacterium RIFCSPHIGHO2_02_FULL_45_35]OHA34886.1 MAG: hypothetical protein A3A22_02870 [Candidatus Taylorbacteria bacterium RIFCSPLOWO2_01_FULL_45_34b]
MSKTNIQKSKIKNHLIIAILTILLGGASALFSLGYRLGPTGLPTKTGSLIIQNLPEGARVFVDGKDMGVKNGGSYARRLLPGEHSVLVAKTAHWPWTKTVSIIEKEAVELQPFTIPESVSGEFITSNDPRHDPVLSQINNTTAPTLKKNVSELLENESLADWLQQNIPNLRVSKKGNVALWLSGQEIQAAWIGTGLPKNTYFCPEKICGVISVFKSASPIQNIDFFDDRDDVFLFSSREGLFAVELPGGDVQNFQPIYLGAQIRFIKGIDVLYLTDSASNLMRLPL